MTQSCKCPIYNSNCGQQEEGGILISRLLLRMRRTTNITGNPGSVKVPQYGSSKITVFVWGKNTILKFLGNTKYSSMKLTLQLIVVVLIALTKFRDNLR